MVVGVMPRLSANARTVIPLLSWAAIKARHFAAVVFVIPPDRDEADGRSQMGLPGAYPTTRPQSTNYVPNWSVCRWRRRCCSPLAPST